MFGLSAPMWLSAIVAIFAVCVTAILWYLKRNDRYWEKRGVKSQPRPNIFQVIWVLAKKSIPELMLENYKNYGRFYGTFKFSVPMLSVAEPELLKKILVKDFHVFSNREDTSFKDPLLDNMVNILKGEDWKRVRTIITPAFTSKQMRKMSHIINSCTNSILEIFQKHSEKAEPVDCKALFGAFTIDVIALSVFATKADSLRNPDHVFVKMMKNTFSERVTWKGILFSLVPRRILAYFRVGGLKSMYFFKQVVLQVMEERKKSNQKYDDLLQTLINAADEENKVISSTEDDADHYGSISTFNTTSSLKYKRLSQDELIAQCVLFFFVGYETTASTLTFMAYSLALNQEWQDKLIGEVDESFEKHNVMSYDAVRDMKVLDAVVSETLRMYPPAVATARLTSEDYKLEEVNLVIEKGTPILIPIYGIHYDPDFFPEPEKFNPERFMDSAEYRHPQYSYLPFGEGPRNCLGMRFALLEIKLCMANILRHYRFKVGPTTKVPLELKKGSAFLSVNELPLAVEKR